MTNRRQLWSFIKVALVLAAAACSGPPGAIDSGTPDAGCGGKLGCACSATQACTAGECVGQVCTNCRRGEEACSCRSNGTCNAGLMCSNALCTACPAGANGCACGAGDACDTGLTCTAGTCAPDTCVAGATACPCRAADPKCDATLYCDGMSLCRACSSDVAGCPCGAGNTCGGGLVCGMNTTCRVPLTCAQLRSAGMCRPNQLCNEPMGGDAVCVPGTCEAQFKWNAQEMSCDACNSLDCANEPSCDGGVGPTADGGSCEGLNRSCAQVGLTASCSSCLMGFSEPAGSDGGTACVAAPVCGGVTCSLNQYCDSSGMIPTCRPLPCPAGQAQETLLDGGAGACIACSNPCTGQLGFSGRRWPFATAAGVCVCETLPGYFIQAGNSGQATPCDADQDGWVHQEADGTAVRSQPALLANARCSMRLVDRVRLEDEYGMAAEVRSCASGLLLNPPSSACTSTVPMRLLETARNDTPGLAGVNPAPVYGANGRLLAAGELNSLTKACVETIGDYNDNGVSDITETQARVTSQDDRARLESFAFFLELHESFYEAPTVAGSPGTLVIRERSRCGSEFPLRYDFDVTDPADAGDGYFAGVDAGNGMVYWRSCARRRDSAFATPSPLGMDFGQWTCPALAGSCPAVPPAHPTLVAPTNPATALLRKHGLCELRGSQPADLIWRGMGHHSQFKCVSVSSSGNAYDRHPNLFAAANPTDGGSGTGLVFNRCNAKPCATPGDPDCSLPQGSGAQTRLPVVECLARMPNAGEVGFAAMPYQPYGRPDAGYASALYVNGCVNEDTETAAVPPLNPSYDTYTCPYPEFSLNKPAADTAFGRYSCYGREPNFLWCKEPCPASPDRATLRWANGPLDLLNGFLR